MHRLRPMFNSFAMNPPIWVRLLYVPVFALVVVAVGERRSWLLGAVPFARLPDAPVGVVVPAGRCAGKPWRRRIGNQAPAKITAARRSPCESSCRPLRDTPGQSDVRPRGAHWVHSGSPLAV